MIAASRQRVREDPIVRRQQIVDNAIGVIGQQGFNGFTIQLLAARCGLSNAGLLYYFGSKDKLLIALLDEVERQELEVVGPLVAAATDVPAATQESLDKRMGLLRTIVQRYAERPAIGRFILTLQSESLDPVHPAHEWFCKRQDEALGMFEAMVTGFVEQPALVARLLFALVSGLSEQWLRTDGGFDLLNAWDEGARRMVPLYVAAGSQRPAEAE